MAVMRNHCSLGAVEGSIEQTCATCDHYVDGWDGRHHVRCGLCWMRWQNMVDFDDSAKLGIDAASVCMVERSHTCDDWTEADDDD